ncbi:hypothetical protein F5Y16DRAFT_377167 [Xylariaceae sp. FL0255]|nr:hypothetical protein F5Y16DRAFT_377167 [Xylariaceae sp. FL0255]
MIFIISSLLFGVVVMRVLRCFAVYSLLPVLFLLAAAGSAHIKREKKKNFFLFRDVGLRIDEPYIHDLNIVD